MDETPLQAATSEPLHGGPEPPPPTPRRQGRRLHPVVNLACLLLTIMTTLIAGALMVLDDLSWPTVRDVALSPRYWSLGWPYSLSLILILGAHEMGHYLACRLYRIDATLPFFLPAPQFFGTFGAVIRIRAPITHRKALFDIGVAGPIAGFVVAMPVALYGLSQSTITQDPPKPGDIALPSCLLLEALYARFFPGLPPGASVHLSPVFVASWLGLFATALNLLPIGQLDGGHMLYSMSRHLHRIVSRAGSVVLILCGLLLGGWHLVTFGLLFSFLGPGHPPLLDESDSIGPVRAAIAVIAGAIFVLCFIVQTPQIF